MNLHPQFIRQEGSEEYVVRPITKFRAVIEALEDYQDLQDLRSAKEAERTAASTLLADVVSQLEL
ncbi:MAG: type II toxin-antitoxin system Phd/YefM family antitoxin [Thiohalocapsa sp. PB-PSB1]|jgi:hypothetical protein|nr:MAG: hypothetical protein N838_20295 [Thiohalocapsa sp. PB-PSB1]QQO57119.1 MAG: type II toxin-antitoxin system Phd/YefM family antitoxin [Thiohalocapsa sp. PB-PSB1]HCS90773.1 prevent-host-death family protein [Chromatiaceae bacterium]